MRSLPAGGLSVGFEPGSLVAYPRSGGGFLDPVTDRDGQLLLPRQASEDAVRDNIIVFELDDRDLVTDILTISNSRDNKQVLMPLQSIVSLEGAELNWAARGRTDWTVERDGSELALGLTGDYVDPGLPAQPSYYLVQSEPPGGVDADQGPVYYATVLQRPGDELLGATAEEVRAKGAPLTPSQRRAAEDPEAAAYVEWNSFIEDDYVSGQGLLCSATGDIKYYNGNDRGFSFMPASDAFDARGETRSKLSVRVGSSFDKTGAGQDLNGMYFNRWFFRKVGTTQALDENYKVLETHNAGTSGLTLDASNGGLTGAYRRAKADIPNPLCKVGGAVTAPSINWTMQVTTTNQNDTVQVTGEFDQAPSTEILWERWGNMSDPSTSIGGCLFRFHNQGFTYLAPPAPNATFSLTLPNTPYNCPVVGT